MATATSAEVNTLASNIAGVVGVSAGLAPNNNYPTDNVYDAYFAPRMEVSDIAAYPPGLSSLVSRASALAWFGR